METRKTATDALDGERIPRPQVPGRFNFAGLRGLSYGYTYLGVFGVGAAGAAMAGFILTDASSWALFLVLAGVAVVAAVLAGTLMRTRR